MTPPPEMEERQAASERPAVERRGGASGGRRARLARQGGLRMDQALLAQLPPQLGRDRRLHEPNVVRDLVCRLGAGQNLGDGGVREGELDRRGRQRNVVFLQTAFSFSAFSMISGGAGMKSKVESGFGS
jgi:hypothetical protein